MKVSHDQIVRMLLEERVRAEPAALSDAFLASLGTRNLSARSGLGSYAFAANFPDHAIASTPRRLLQSGGWQCQYCGFVEFDEQKDQELNVLEFERSKWAGVRHDHPVYAWLDLSLFRAMPPAKPAQSDRRVMRTVLEIAGSLPPAATAGTLEKALMGIFASNKNERRMLIEILSKCGVLQPKGRAGYFGEFALAVEREETGQHFNDWQYPAVWWRGSDGVKAVAVRAYFPDL